MRGMRCSSACSVERSSTRTSSLGEIMPTLVRGKGDQHPGNPHAKGHPRTPPFASYSGPMSHHWRAKRWRIHLRPEGSTTTRSAAGHRQTRVSELSPGVDFGRTHLLPPRQESEAVADAVDSQACLLY